MAEAPAKMTKMINVTVDAMALSDHYNMHLINRVSRIGLMKPWQDQPLYGRSMP